MERNTTLKLGLEICIGFTSTPKIGKNGITSKANLLQNISGIAACRPVHFSNLMHAIDIKHISMNSDSHMWSASSRSDIIWKKENPPLKI